MRGIRIRIGAGTGLALLAVIGLGMAAAGCGRRAEEDRRAGRARVRRSGDRVSVRTPEGRVTIDARGSAELPRGFPGDIPLPKGGAIQMAMDTPEGFLLMIELQGAAQAAAGDHRAAMSDQGWTEDAAVDMGMGVTISFQKDGRSVQSSFFADQGVTRVQLMVAR